MSEQQTGSRIRVEAMAVDGQERAKEWAQRLGLPLHNQEADFALQLTDVGLQLQQLDDDAPVPCAWTLSKGGCAPTFVRWRHRANDRQGSRHSARHTPQCLDATAGLGRMRSCWRVWAVT